MRTQTKDENRCCPKCGRCENQINGGYNRSGTQRCFCNECKKYYTLDPKKREIPEEVRQQAIKTYYAGASGRGVGKVFGFSKANVYNWIHVLLAIQPASLQIVDKSIKNLHFLFPVFALAAGFVNRDAVDQVVKHNGI